MPQGQGGFNPLRGQQMGGMLGGKEVVFTAPDLKWLATIPVQLR
jgi:hypothetical protein